MTGDLSYDRIIEESKELERWQYAIAALLWLPTLSAGLNIMSYTFAGFVPSHRCQVPCLDNNTRDTIDLSHLDWYQNIDPAQKLASDCQFYEYVGEEELGAGCEAEMFNSSSITSCSSYVYDKSVFQETLVTKFDLVCSDSWKKGFIGKWRA